MRRGLPSAAVVIKRPRGRDDIAKFVDDGAVMLEFWNVDSYKVHWFPPFEISALLFATENLSMDSRKMKRQSVN